MIIEPFCYVTPRSLRNGGKISMNSRKILVKVRQYSLTVSANIGAQEDLLNFNLLAFKVSLSELCCSLIHNFIYIL